jgi:hypothetical protein
MATAVMQKQNLSTPQTLWASLYIIWALDLFLLLAAIIGVGVHRGAMQTIGKDAAPSIIAAQTIKTSLADMDADVANGLLNAKDAMGDYDDQRTKAATALIEAAKNITYGAAEQQPIEAIQAAMGVYEAKVQHARDLRDWGDEGFVDAYRAAAQVMDVDLLPQADNLDKANNDQLQATYGSQSGNSIASLIFLLVMAAGLVGMLVVVQSYLNKRTRRILNPMLVLATLLTVGFVLYTVGILSAERSDLKVAKEDAFESVHALWRAKAVAYAANTDESRYLLDPKHAFGHEQAFQQKAQTLKSGYLAQELGNITFEGEREAATRAVQFWDKYMEIDRKIRDLETHGKHAQAIALCIGNNEGESNWAFNEFDKAIDTTLKINQDQFNASVEEGFSTLAHFEIKAGVLALIIALLSFFGLLKRIQEYR